MAEVVRRLRPYMLGWKAYFGLSQTPRVSRTLDEWLRHRLRAIQLKHWKRGKTIFRELRALGASVDVAAQVAGKPNGGGTTAPCFLIGCCRLLTLTGWGCPDSHDLNFSNRPVRTRMPGGVAGPQSIVAALYADGT